MALNFKANFSLQTGAVLVNLGGPCQVLGQIEISQIFKAGEKEEEKK